MKPAMERFLSHVNKTDTCWLWTGSLCKKGYGQFNSSGCRPCKVVKAHRWSYEQHKGPIPAGLMIRHACDVRECVNPEHLSYGTNDDNIRDRMERGRHGNPLRNFRLNEDDVREIRILRGFGFTQRDLAARFSVGKTTISRVWRGETWSTVV